MRAVSLLAWTLGTLVALGCSGRAVSETGPSTLGAGGEDQTGAPGIGGRAPFGGAGGIIADSGGAFPIGLGGSGPIDPGGSGPIDPGGDSSGGSAGADSEGGAPGDDELPCVPASSIACACTTGESGAQICGEDGRYQPCVCDQGTLAWFRLNMVGVWVGTRTTPWDTSGPVSVTLEFKSEGTWTGASDSDDSPVFYYGSPVETSENRYDLTSTNDDHLAFGRLRLTWGVNQSTEGDLRKIRFEANETQLFFEFWATWAGEYGPIAFTLHRQ